MDVPTVDIRGLSPRLRFRRPSLFGVAARLVAPMPSVGLKTWFWVILTVAFLMRSGGALGFHWLLEHRWHRSFVIEGDANGYWQLAQQIADGEEFAIYSPPRQVLRMPGFPLLLAIPIRLSDAPLLWARLMLAAVGTCACGLVCLLGCTLFDARVGVTAMSLAAVSPALVGFAPLILSETLFATGLLLSLIAIAHLLRAEGWLSKYGEPPDTKEAGASSGLVRGMLRALIAGLSIGLTCLVRPSWLLAGPLVGLLVITLAPDRRRGAIYAVAMIAASLLTLVPWGLRNQRVTGHFVLSTLWMGPSLYDGLNADATGESNMEFYDRDNLMGQGMSEYDVNRHYRNAAWDFVRSQPGRALQLAGIKLWRYIKPWPNASQFAGWLPTLLISAFTLPMYLFAIWGLQTLRRDHWRLLLTLGPLLYFAALHMVFVSSLRYRLPAEYPLLVLSAVGLLTVWRRNAGRLTTSH